MHCNIFLHVRHLFLAYSFALYRVKVYLFLGIEEANP